MGRDARYSLEIRKGELGLTNDLQKWHLHFKSTKNGKSHGKGH